MPCIKRVLVALLLILALIACSSPPDPTPLPPEPTILLTDTPAPLPVATDTNVPDTPEAPTPEPVNIVVATDDSIEQRLIGQLMVMLLRENGVSVIDQTGMGDARTVRRALELGEVDVALALTGLTLTEFQNIPPASLPTEAERSYQLAKTLDEPNGLVWLEPADYNATPVILVREALSEEGIRNLDDLSQYMNENRIRLCVPDDYDDLKLRGLLDTYMMRIAEEDLVRNSAENVLTDLREGLCNAGIGQITDGRIDAWDLSIVLDNQGYFPINNPAPVVQVDVLESYPAIKRLMKELFDGLSGRIVQTLGAQIIVGTDGELGSGDERTLDAVVQRYLERSGLMGDLPAIKVGITGDEAEGLLGLLLAFELLENGFEVQERTYSDETLLRDALEQGDVDIVWDESAHALTTYHNIPKTALPDDADAMYRLAQSLDLQYHNLSWQQPALFNAGDSMFTTLATLETIDDVAAALEGGADLRLCLATGDYESLLEDWTQLYAAGFSPESIVITEPELVLPTIGDGDCDLGISPTTNPQAIEFELQRLSDPSNLLRISNHAPIVRQDTLSQHPQLSSIIAGISDVLSEETYLAMRAQISLGIDGEPESGDEEDVSTIVNNFLADTRVLRDRPAILIGAQEFTETLLLAEMSRLLFREAGFESVDTLILDNSVNDQYTALNEGVVDLTWVYLGAALQVIHQEPETIGDATLARQRLEQLDESSEFRWLQQSNFNNTFALLIKPSLLEIESNLTSIEELATYMNNNDSPLSICVEEDFFKRPDGLQALQVEYGFEFDESLIQVIEFGELYSKLAAGECDVAEGFRTDGRIETQGFRSLIDSRNFFPAYNASPVVQSALVGAYPNLTQAFEQLAVGLTNKTMVELNALIDFGSDAIPDTGDEELIETVAELYLCEQKLISSQCAATNRPKTVVASAPDPNIGCDAIDINGGFEEPTVWEIPNTRISATYSTEEAHTGNQSIRMGIASGEIEGHTIVEQTVELPEDATSAEVSFWYMPKSTDVYIGDIVALQIYDTAITEAKDTIKLQLNNDGEWTQANVDLTPYIGEQFELYFVVINDGDDKPTLAYIDDVSLQVCH